MEGDRCAFVEEHFGDAELGDQRRNRTLVKAAACMERQPEQPLTRCCESSADLKAAYRLVSNDAVAPEAIGRPHQLRTLEACEEHPVVLCVQDTTNLDLTSRRATSGLGKIGNGRQRGLLQHSALAVAPLPDDRPLDHGPGHLLGVLHQRWAKRTEAPQGETHREMERRRTDADVWLETARAVAELGDTPARLIHVGDRHADIFRFYKCCKALGHGFVVRARYDRTLADPPPDVDEQDMAQDMAMAMDMALVQDKLFDALAAQPIEGRREMTVHQQRTARGEVRCKARRTTLTVRHRTVTLAPPAHDSRTRHDDPCVCHAVLVEEERPPEDDAQPLRWMLLTTEPVESEEDAWRIVRYYRHRWVIEEWHRVLKEGCRVEGGQFDQAMDFQRVAAIKGVLAVRMLWLRDLADTAGDDPGQLQRMMSWTWIIVVARLAGAKPETMTPRAFYLTIAKRGGYLNRKNDPRPGWKVLWRGWSDVELMVQTVESFDLKPRCG